MSHLVTCIAKLSSPNKGETTPETWRELYLITKIKIKYVNKINSLNIIFKYLDLFHSLGKHYFVHCK